MQESDFNKTSSSDGKFRTAVIVGGVIGLFMFVGLAAYTWQLQKQLAELRPAPENSALYSLFDQPSANTAQPVNPLVQPNSQLPTDPFQHMEQIRQQMDAMMNSVFGAAPPAISGIPGLSATPGSSLFGADLFGSLGMNQPAINLRETEQALELVIPVQQGQEFELTTDVQEDRLTVAGTVSWQQQSSQNGVNSRREGSSQFSRTVVLPANVDPTGLVTEHRENEIVISLPKV